MHLIIFKKLMINWNRPATLYIIGITGVICMLYSEKDHFFPIINEREYLISHCNVL